MRPPLAQSAWSTPSSLPPNDHADCATLGCRRRPRRPEPIDGRACFMQGDLRNTIAHPAGETPEPQQAAARRPRRPGLRQPERASHDSDPPSCHSERAKRVEESPEGRHRVAVLTVVPRIGGPFDSLGGTPSLRVTEVGATLTRGEPKKTPRDEGPATLAFSRAAPSTRTRHPPAVAPRPGVAAVRPVHRCPAAGSPASARDAVGSRAGSSTARQ